MSDSTTRRDRTAAAIDIQDLHKSFGDNEVLKGIDFHVDNGQVVCVIGPSGSGQVDAAALRQPAGGADVRPDLRRGRSRSPTPTSTSTRSAPASAWCSSSSTCSRT